MDNENTTHADEQDSSLVYIVGAIIIIAVIVAGIILWPKGTKKQEATAVPEVTEQKVENRPVITKLVCERQWYNPVVGLPKHYLSIDGGTLDSTTKVDCALKLYNGNTLVADEKAEGKLTASPERGGKTYVCTTKAIENLPTGVALKLVSNVTNDLNETASCTGTLTLR